jgi:biotin carboxyl carrier protein
MSGYKVKILDKLFDIAQSPDGKIIFVNDNPYSVELIKKLGNSYNVFSVNGKNFRLGIDELEENKYNLHLENRDLIVETTDSKTDVIQQYMKNTGSTDSGGLTKIKAPMPGLIVKIFKQVNDTVKKGETVAIIEAMKMENSIKSNVDGTILAIDITEGKPVVKDGVMFEIG